MKYISLIIVSILFSISSSWAGEYYVLFKEVRDKQGGDVVISYYTNIIECSGDNPSTNGFDKLAKKFFDGVEAEDPDGAIHLTASIDKPKVDYGGYAMLTAESLAEKMRKVLWSGKYAVIKGGVKAFHYEESAVEVDIIGEIGKLQDVQPLKNMPIN